MRLILALCIFLTSTGVFASKTTDVMRDAFMEQLLEQIASQAMNRTAGSFVIGSNSIGVGNSVLGVWNIYQTGKEFGKSQTDSQKYYTGMRAIGSAVGIFNSAVGAAISLSATGLQMVGAYGSSESMKNTLRLQKETLEIMKRTFEIHNRLQKLEEQEFEKLKTYINNTQELIFANDKKIRSSCAGEDKMQTLAEIDNCVMLLVSKNTLLTKFMSLANRIGFYKGIYISVITELEKKEINIQDYLKNFEATIKIYDEFNVAYEHMINALVNLKLKIIELETAAHLEPFEKDVQCENTIQQSLAEINHLSRGRLLDEVNQNLEDKFVFEMKKESALEKLGLYIKLNCNQLILKESSTITYIQTHYPMMLK